MASIGTLFYTWLFGSKVGEDEFGNRYYHSSRKQGEHIGRGTRERRWVVYKGRPDPSKVPPYWHGWLHHIYDTLPIGEDRQKQYAWEKDHLPNLSGTDFAYRPPGHISQGGVRQKASADYEPWKPS